MPLGTRLWGHEGCHDGWGGSLQELPLERAHLTEPAMGASINGVTWGFPERSQLRNGSEWFEVALELLTDTTFHCILAQQDVAAGSKRLAAS